MERGWDGDAAGGARPGWTGECTWVPTTPCTPFWRGAGRQPGVVSDPCWKVHGGSTVTERWPCIVEEGSNQISRGHSIWLVGGRWRY